VVPTEKVPPGRKKCTHLRKGEGQLKGNLGRRERYKVRDSGGPNMRKGKKDLGVGREGQKKTPFRRGRKCLDRYRDPAALSKLFQSGGEAGRASFDLLYEKGLGLEPEHKNRRKSKPSGREKGGGGRAPFSPIGKGPLCAEGKSLRRE